MKKLQKTLLTAFIMACLCVTNAWGTPWYNTELHGNFADGSNWTTIAYSGNENWNNTWTVDASGWTVGSKSFGVLTTDGSNNTYWFANGGTLTVGGGAITLSRTSGNNCSFYHDGTYTSYTFTVNYSGTGGSDTEGHFSVSVTGVQSTPVDPVVDPSGTTTAGFFLVGNFFWSGASNSSLRDPANSINYNRRIFKFTEQTDGSYAVDIPATVTAYAQILGVDGTTETIYGPGGSYDIHATWPSITDGQATGTLTSQTSKSLSNNYWNITSRNNGSVDDDGIYTVSFTLNASGVPSNWKFKHNHRKRLAYFLSTAPGAIVTPMYNTRNNGVTQAFDNKMLGSLHFDPAYSYYLITNIVHKDWASDNILDYAQDIDRSAHQNVNNRDIQPTVNKLVFCGNGGYNFKNQNPYNEFSPNEDPMTATDRPKGSYRIEFNPSNGARASGTMTVDGTNYGQNHWSALNSNHKGIRGQFQFKSDGTSDYTIKSVSLVGPAFPNSMSGSTWQWTSTAYDMTYDVTEDCYKYTIESQDSELSKFFRFVANHQQKTNWYETNTTALIPYNGSAVDGKSAATTRDPNDVAWTENGTSEHTNLTNVDNIIWNRPSGEWTIRFYIKQDIDTSNDFNFKYYYTITGHEYVPVEITGLRTFSYDVALDLPADGSVMAYEAYSYDKGSSTASSTQHGTITLRRLRYIPANMGVVLKYVTDPAHPDVQVDPQTATKVSAKLLKRNVDNTNLTTANDDYTADKETEYWHAWYKQGVTGYTSTTPWNNYLVGTVTRTLLPTNGKIENGEFVERYFALSTYYRCADHLTSIPDYYGFFRYKNNQASGANKAYLSLPSTVLDYNGQFIGQTADEPAGALSAQYLLFDDDFVTNGIGTVNTDTDNRSADKAWYTLQGVRVSHPTKGIYIHEGKKVIIR